jgi:hypothetical protein
MAFPARILAALAAILMAQATARAVEVKDLEAAIQSNTCPSDRARLSEIMVLEHCDSTKCGSDAQCHAAFNRCVRDLTRKNDAIFAYNEWLKKACGATAPSERARSASSATPPASEGASGRVQLVPVNVTAQSIPGAATSIGRSLTDTERAFIAEEEKRFVKDAWERIRKEQQGRMPGHRQMGSYCHGQQFSVSCQRSCETWKGHPQYESCSRVCSGAQASCDAARRGDFAEAERNISEVRRINDILSQEVLRLEEEEPAAEER